MSLGSKVDRRKPAGILGRSYAVRHSYGHYRSCAVSGKYIVPHPQDNDCLIHLLQYAVSQSITRHPTLCYGMVERVGGEEAHLYHLEKIAWEDVVELHTEVPTDGDVEMCKQIGIGHEHLFTRQTERPAWRLIVLSYEITPGSCKQRVDILFHSHHAFVDGTACAAFHKTIFQHLQEGICLIANEQRLRAQWPYVVPEEIPSPLFVEDVYPLAKYLDIPPLANIDPLSSTSKPWTSVPPFMDSIESFRSRALALTISNQQTTTILASCCSSQITLTGLIHGLITLYLARALPSATSFQASTPMSMRRFTATPNDELVNHVSFIEHDWSTELVSRLRKSTPSSPEEASAVVEVARRFQEQVRDEILAMPDLGPTGLKAMASVKDLDAFCEQSMQKEARSGTYEISNVGLVAMTAIDEGVESSNDLRVEKLVFSQCGMVAGPAFGCGIVSIAGGALCMCLHWQEGAVDEAMMIDLKGFIETKVLILMEEKNRVRLLA